MLASVALLTVLLLAGGDPGPSHARQRHPAAAAHRTTDEPRAGILAFEVRLDHAIGRVSLPHAARLLGRDSARGYRLPGYGLVFVLAPRALPGASSVVYRFGGPAQLAHAAPKPPAPGSSRLPPEIESVERQVIILQHETEQTRQAAERDMERIVHDVRVRMAPAEAAAGDGAAPPALPGAPAEPAAADPQTPPPPPWKYWFESDASHDERKPETVIADVRRALVDALASQPSRPPGLQPDESVTVAVDFEPAGLFVTAALPARTLIVRARVRDLDARARGAITVDELRRRLEVSEY
jgi:hypothetical protein